VENRTILVVEDDQHIREAIAEVLEAEGYAVIGARTGKEGLEALCQVGPSLILLDLMMPLIDGAAFREAQLADPDVADIPVVVVSAAGDPGRVPADEFIAKPFDIDALLDAVARRAARDRPPASPSGAVARAAAAAGRMAIAWSAMSAARAVLEKSPGAARERAPRSWAATHALWAAAHTEACEAWRQATSRGRELAAGAAGAARPPDVREPRGGSPAPRDLYPYVMGGLLHDALNSMVALQHHASKLREASSPSAVALGSGLERVARVLQLMQQISRACYRPTDDPGRPEPVEAAVESFRRTHPEITYDLVRAAPLELPPGVASFLVAELLENATRACGPRGSGRVALTIDADERTSSVVCEDDGVGFPAPVLARQRGAMRPPPPGARRGYGLYLMTEVVQRLEGTISLSNLEGGGAHVRILLPRGGTP
jgi:CheY-like chemotaxis protein